MITIPTTFVESVTTAFGTFKCTKLSNQNTRWGVEKLLSGFDGDQNTKALWFTSSVTLFYESPSPTLDVTEIELITGNDAPERDPAIIELHFSDETVVSVKVPVTSARIQKVNVPIEFNTGDLVAMVLTSQSGSILQFSELKFIGTESQSPVEPTPEPVEPTPEPVGKEIAFITANYTDGTTEDFFPV